MRRRFVMNGTYVPVHVRYNSARCGDEERLRELSFYGLSNENVCRGVEYSGRLFGLERSRLFRREFNSFLFLRTPRSRNEILQGLLPLA